MGLREACRAGTEFGRALAAMCCIASDAVVIGLCVSSTASAQALVGPIAQGTASFVSADPTVQVIKARLTQRLSGFPNIDEIRASGMPGLYEVRLGSEVFYSDAQGNYLIRGELIDTRSQRNLTRERIDRLSAIDFDKLPRQDAILWKSGTGKRRIVVFADPNCPYCKRLESELRDLKDVSVYTFLYPILAPDSTTKSQAIWCNTDPVQSRREWMLKGTTPEAAQPCATPIERNLAAGRANHIDGVPMMFFEDGTRIPGFVTTAQIEQRLTSISAK